MFAERPYMCREVLDQAPQRLHVDLRELMWPETVDSAETETCSDGSVSLSSVDQNAVVIFAPCRQFFTIRFLCQLGKVIQSQKTKTTRRKADERRSLSPEDSFTSVTSLSDSKDSISATSQRSHTKSQDDCHSSPRLLSDATESTDSSFKTQQSNTSSSTSQGDRTAEQNTEEPHACVWVTQHHSVHSYPDCWTQPCSLLLQSAKRNLNSVHFEESSGENVGDETAEISPIKCDKLQKLVCAPVPKTLPVNCVAQHLHKWGEKSSRDGEHSDSELMRHGRLKVVCSQGIIYRFVTSGSPGIEIYPGDGSILKSSNLAGHYFTHHFFKNGKVEEKMHSVLYPAPDRPGAKYSLGRVLATGSRFLQQLCDENVNLLDQDTQICWKVEPQSMEFQCPQSTQLLEECEVAGVGRFTAHSNNRIRVIFTDRTALDMTADLSPRLQKYSKSPQEIALHSYQNKMGRSSRASDLPEGVCRLLLPSGHYQFIPVLPPGQYHKYIEAAQDWIKWVNSCPKERYDFYKNTVHDPEMRVSINQELQKINCFNYIIDHTVMNKVEAKPADSKFQKSPRLLGVTGATSSQNLSDDVKASLGHTQKIPCVYSSVSAASRPVMDNQPMTLQSVQEALQNTSRAVRDLDQFLERK